MKPNDYDDLLAELSVEAEELKSHHPSEYPSHCGACFLRYPCPQSILRSILLETVETMRGVRSVLQDSAALAVTLNRVLEGDLEEWTE